MIGVRRWWLWGGLGALLLLGVSPARADGGRIGFAGMIVESTCAAGPDLQPSVAAPSQPIRLDCATPAAGQSQQVYVASRVALSHDEPDQVLQYFHDYMQALQPGTAPTLVVRTYE